MAYRPRWVRDQLRGEQDVGFRSVVLRFADPVDTAFADSVSDDLADKAPVGWQWLVNRESTRAVRLTLVPARL